MLKAAFLCRSVLILLLLSSAGCYSPKESSGHVPLVPYAQTRETELTFADIDFVTNQPQDETFALNLTTGICPIENPFWDIPDPRVKRVIDYSGYSIDLCEKLKEDLVSCGMFSSAIELPVETAVLSDSEDFASAARRWGCQSVLTGKVLNQDGDLQIMLHLADGRRVFSQVFPNCWQVSKIPNDIIKAMQNDPSIIALAKTDSETIQSIVNIAEQPNVRTARVILKTEFEREKIYSSTQPGGRGGLLGLMVESIATKGEGQATKGRIVVTLDGIVIDEELSPAKKERGKLIYRWQREVRVRPGKHRLILSNISVAKAEGRENLYGFTPFLDFEVKEAETTKLQIVPVYKDKWLGGKDLYEGVQRWEIKRSFEVNNSQN